MVRKKIHKFTHSNVVQLYEKDGFMMQFRFLTGTYQALIIEAVKSLQLVERELRVCVQEKNTH